MAKRTTDHRRRSARDTRTGRLVAAAGLSLLCGSCAARPDDARRDRAAATQPSPTTIVSIADVGAVGDGTTLNTVAIQLAIDRLAEHGRGTLVVPRGVFVSGALFFKPGVTLRLDKDAVLRCSTDVERDFPPRPTRIEGQWHGKFTPALINADGCDGFHITGDGALDGAGRPIWDEFWRLRNAAPDRNNFPNLSVPRARLVFIQNARDVVIRGVTFKDSQFWNLHLYRCRHALIDDARFAVPDDYKQAPSTDGIDVDSCQDVTVHGCAFSVTDDCIALKGSKGPHASDDEDSPPVEHVRVSDCTFRRGHAMVTLGSEATRVHDVIVESCSVSGAMTLANFKLRADTPQDYEDVHVRGIVVNTPAGRLIAIEPWGQYTDLHGQPPPQSIVHDITLSDITGHSGSLGVIRPNAGQTQISDVTLDRIDVQLNDGTLRAEGVTRLSIVNTNVNGKPYAK